MILKKLTIKILVLFVLLSALLLLPWSSAYASEEPKRVLLLFAEDQSFPFMAALHQSIKTTLLTQAPASRFEFYNEHLDRMRIPDVAYEAELVRFWQKKYEGRKIDLIFVCVASALDLLSRHPSELFPGVPVVFCVISQQEVSGIHTSLNVTGVWSAPPFRPTLELALRLHPDTRRVMVVTGMGEFDKGLLAIAKRDFNEFENEKLEVVYLTDLTIGELQQRLASLPKQTIVIHLSYSKDRAGVVSTGPEIVATVASASIVPVYGISRTYLGSGIVGGSLISFEDMGVRAAEIGTRILAGERPQDIAPESVPTALMFDWREMRRRGVSEKNLPPGSVVRYQEFSVWELYKWRIIGAISLIVLQALGIAWLVFTRVKRRQAEIALKENQAQLAGIIGSAMDAIVSVDEKQRVVLFNAAAENMFGCATAEAVGKPLDRFIPSFLRAKSQTRASDQKLPENAAIHVGSFAHLTGRRVSGDNFPIDVSVSEVELNGGRFYTIILRDITERLRAEQSLRERKEELTEAQRVARVGSWEWDPNTDVVTWSEEMFRIVGCDPSLPLPSFKERKAQYTGASWQRVETALRAALQDGTPFELELEMISDNGELVWTNARGEVLLDADGKIIKLRGTFQDISERKKAEEALRKAMEEVSQLKNKLEEENIYLREEINLAQNFDEIVGRSDATRYVLFKIGQVAPTNSTVLISGETGTGKELVARAIHSSGLRKDRPLVKVNCAALSPTLIESELFGHEKGAFTGAATRKLGRFELANGATIFLDEIGEVPLELQSKLLRVIQEGEFERLGNSKTIKVDARIIAATNRNLKFAVEQGSFRQDLWYRLNVFPITVPPLRDRKEDIPSLVEHFTKRFSQKLGRRISAIAPASLRTLQDYAWPGNVRELANVIERAVINTSGTVLRVVDHFETPIVLEQAGPDKTLAEVEKEYIIRILQSTNWRIDGSKGAARILGLNPSTLRTRTAKLGIQKLDSATLSSVV